MLPRWVVRGYVPALLFLGSMSATLEATFHFTQIEQVIGGVNGDTSAQAIQLRMRSGVQNQVQQARLRAWDSAGANPVLLIDFTHSVPNQGTGVRILICGSNFVDATNPTAAPDFTLTNLIPASYLAAGSLTFEDNFGTVYWRLSWGGASYTGSTFGDSTNDNDVGLGPADFGPPFGGPLPSTSLQALHFTESAGALSTTNAADYLMTSAAAVFTNNAGAGFTVTGPVVVPGDLDGDLDVDLDDYSVFAGCMSGPQESDPPPTCDAADFEAADLDGDDDVDLRDWAAFKVEFDAAVP